MTSATMARCYMKPQGYPEDPETLELIYRDEPKGDGRLGPYLDRWFLSRPICRARRNGLRLMTAFLKEALAAVRGAGPVPLTSLVCGTARELFGVLSDNTISILATCLDSDADALRAAAALARERGWADRLTVVRANVIDVARGLGRVSLGPQHVIYALGLFDYLTDEEVRVLLDWVYDHLDAGGPVALTQLDAQSPDRAFLEHLLEWKVQGRDEGRLRELFGDSKFRGRPLNVQRDEAGVGLMATCRK